MAWKKKSSATFTGGSGQMAVMSELLHRKCNAAIPHVDVGTDVFAFQDDREDVARIQVKTAPGKRYKKGPGYSAEFRIPMAQLRRTDEPPLFYVLAVRLADGWESFLVIGRTALQELWNKGCGSENGRSGDLELHVQFRSQATADSQPAPCAQCGEFDLTPHVNAWDSLPPLQRVDSALPHA